MPNELTEDNKMSCLLSSLKKKKSCIKLLRTMKKECNFTISIAKLSNHDQKYFFYVHGNPY
jgi:uncharacterized protein YlxP (DUF503 family)